MSEVAKLEQPRKVQPLPPNKAHHAEYVGNEWKVEAMPGTPIEDLSTPEYWANVSRQMRPRDKIYVWAEDNSYYLELAVIDSGPNWARVVELNRKVFEQPQAAASNPFGGYEVSWGGPQKFRVVRKSDRQTLSKGHATQTDAFAWLAEHLQK